MFPQVASYGNSRLRAAFFMGETQMQRPAIIPGSRNLRHDIPPSEGKAAIRYKNPGAMWPNALAERYGMLGYGQLNDGDNNGSGNKIALFPNAICGAAANMALLATSSHYLGKSIATGQFTWSGSKRTGLPGWDGSKVITADMCRDPSFVIPFMKSIAEFEAPGGSRVLSDAQWREAFDLYQEVEGAPATPAAKPKASPTKKVTGAVVATGGAATAAVQSGMPGWAIAAIVLAGLALVAFIIWKHRG